MAAPPAPLVDYYFSDPRVVLVPIEHLSPAGVSPAFAAVLRERAGWPAAQVALLDAGFASYWSRTAELARRTADWAPPRLRHIAVVAEPFAVHPLAQLLNTSAWTLYADDLDPTRSHPELVAYLLAHGDRMAVTGEVTMAALLNAAWWFERSDAECAAFAAAAERSARPGAPELRALATALGWLRQLGHETLRPGTGMGSRAVPGTGLLVPIALSDEPPTLVDSATVAAGAAADAYEERWRGGDFEAVRGVLAWLADTGPPLLIVTRAGRLLWDPAEPERIAALRGDLERACGAAVRDLRVDLEVVDQHTRRFLAACVDPAALPTAGAAAEQGGYVFMHRDRRLLAYNLDEPSVDRRRGPALPYARAMLGARAVHEWAHLAVEAGWVPCTDAAEHARRVAALADLLDAAVGAAPAEVRAASAADLDALLASEAVPSPGTALAWLIVRRMADFQANLLAQRFLDPPERETYVRQNIRTLRGEYPAARRWRLLARYLYEVQYLRFSAVADRREFFLRSTWCDADFLANGVLDAARFDALVSAVGAICDGYAVDETRFVLLP